jgi:benzoate transport
VNGDPRRALAEGPLTRFQLAAIAVCIGLNMLDGFDILSMSFAASGVTADWHLQNSQVAALLSAGLVGMGLGSLTLGPCADRWGRRRVVLLSVAVAGCGMLGASVARGFPDLLALRVLTGLGIGGTIASVAVVVSEYSPDRWRRTALGAYATGYSIGATVGGALAAYAIPRYGWRSAFVIGGTMSLLLLPLAWSELPESLDFLLTRRPAGALERVNALLRAMGRPAATALPQAQGGDGPAPHVPVRAQLALIMTPATLLLWVMFFCTMAGFYFIVSWTPKLLHDAGLTASQGLTGGVLLNLGGIAGCALYAAAAARVDAHRLMLAALLGSALLTAAFSLTIAHLDAALWTALSIGIISNAAMAGLYAVGPPLYPTAVRGTGMGWALGIGRFGSIVSPLVGGALLDLGWRPAQLYTLVSVPFAVAAVAILAIGPARRQA